MVRWHVVVLHPIYGAQAAGGVYRTRKEAKAREDKLYQILDSKYKIFIERF